MHHCPPLFGMKIFEKKVSFFDTFVRIFVVISAILVLRKYLKHAHEALAS